jgi:hypothetical protein
MNSEQYLEYLSQMCDKMKVMAAQKCHDYAGFSDSAFSNFEVVEKCDIASVEQGFLTRMMDKVSRINSFLKQGICKVENEKIEDTLLDLASYSILMSAYIKSKKN